MSHRAKPRLEPRRRGRPPKSEKVHGAALQSHQAKLARTDVARENVLVCDDLINLIYEELRERSCTARTNMLCCTARTNMLCCCRAWRHALRDSAAEVCCCTSARLRIAQPRPRRAGEVRGAVRRGKGQQAACAAVEEQHRVAVAESTSTSRMASRGAALQWHYS